jgi:hypothetical protein
MKKLNCQNPMQNFWDELLVTEDKKLRAAAPALTQSLAEALATG